MNTESTIEEVAKVCGVEAPPGVWPFVSIIIPAFNEARFIRRCVESASTQDYPADRLELIVADGMSTDGTREVVMALQKDRPNLRLIDNPARTVAPGLNRALRVARGEVVVRLDAHCEYPGDYVQRVVRLRARHQADSVGGVVVPTGDSYVQRAIRLALASPVGVGGTGLRTLAAAPGLKEVDTVHGGCWRRERLLQVGAFDEEMVRNQDDELSFRLRKTGGRIYQDTAIRVRYHVRDSYRKFFMQFAQYGYWKVRVVQKHPRQTSLRHFVPALFLVLLAVLGLLAPTAVWASRSLPALLGGYLVTVGLVTFIQMRGHALWLWPGAVYALILIHFGYGGGFVLGSLRLWLGRLPTDRFFERTTR